MSYENKNLPQKVEEWLPEIPIKDGVLAPNDFKGLVKMAEVFAYSGMVPEEYVGQPRKIIVAWQLGAKLGLDWLGSLQNIATVHGRPTIYGDLTLGLCDNSGLCEERKEYYEVGGKEMEYYVNSAPLDKWPDDLTAVCKMKRKGRKDPYVGRFSVSDAKRMGKWGQKTSKGYDTVWTKNPLDMLMWRARHRAEKGFSDILRGLIPKEVAEDYVDLESKNGHYEVSKPNEPAPASLLMEMCEKHNINLDAAQNYIKESAEMIGCSEGDLAQNALDNPKAFVDRFRMWSDKNSGSSDNNKPDSGSRNEKNEPQNEDDRNDAYKVERDHGSQGDPEPELVDENPFQDPDMDKIKESVKNEMDSRTDYGIPDTLLQIMYAELNRLDAPEEPEYERLLSEYIDYVTETTRRARKTIVDALISGNSWVEFFLGWVQEDSATGEDEGEEAGRAETQKSPDESPEDSGGELPTPSKDEGNRTSPPESKKQSFKKFWIGKPGKQFKPFVLQNPDKFDKSVIGEDEYKVAVDKWNNLVKSRTGEPWPYGEEKEVSPIKFPEKNAKQVFRQIEKDHPEELQKALDARKFARGALSEEAVKIVVQDVIDIMGGKQIK